MTIKDLTKEEVNKAILSLEKKINSSQAKETVVEPVKQTTNTPTNNSSSSSSSDNKMDKLNPKGNGSFSLNRKDSSTVGSYSTAEGYNSQAKAQASHAEGFETIAGGKSSHAEGNNTIADSDNMHAAGKYNKTTSGVARVTGWGSADERKDIEVLDTNGNLKVTGKVYSDGKELAEKEEVETALDLKADKTEVETALELKADKSDVETALDLKADITYVDEALESKADITDVVLKTDVDEALSTTSTNPIANKTITALIPSATSSENQLADKSFVNSSIATETAYFKGTFNSVEELPTTDVTNNDYAFIKVMDETTGLVKQYDRYKYVSSSQSWVYEYTLNNSSFTSDQWNAINSGITDTLVGKLDGIEDDAQKNVQSDWNQTNDSADDYIKNKPTIPAAQVQSDWNQTTDTAVDYIKNKPTIPTSTSELTNDSGFITEDTTKLPLAGGTMTGKITFASSQTWPTFNQNTTGKANTAGTADTSKGLIPENHTSNDTNYYPIWANGAGNGSNTRGIYTSSDRLKYNPAKGNFQSTRFTIGDSVTLEYNSTTKSLDFIFN